MIKPFENILMCEDMIINGCLHPKVGHVVSTTDTKYNYCINFKKGMTSSLTSLKNTKIYLKNTFESIDFIKNTLNMTKKESDLWTMYFINVWKWRIEKTPTNIMFKKILWRNLKTAEQKLFGTWHK